VKTIEEIQQEIVSEFEQFDDWMDKYNYLIELSRELPLIDPGLKLKENLIPGCQSRVWLNAVYRNGTIEFSADSDAIITKGIISLLIRILSGQPTSGSSTGSVCGRIFPQAVQTDCSQWSNK
jgi:cysteine desulfuration protein SufE